MVAGLVFAGVGLRLGEARRLFGALAATLALLVLGLPGQQRLWSRLHGSEDPASLIDEDATGIGAIVPVPAERRFAVFFDGKNHSSVPFGGVHSRLGALPALLHPAPLDVAIIGLGSGDTAWSAGCRPETRSITVFEIASPLPRLLARLAAREELPDLRALLADPRLRVRIADGRSALRHGQERYDLIEADALWPHVANSGNLYSVEFFDGCARALKPGGLMCTWAPTSRIMLSFTRAFRYVASAAGGTLLVGSNQPLPDDTDVAMRHARSARVRDYLGPGVSHDVTNALKGLRPLQYPRRPPLGRLNEDLYPRDEFGLR
jgi:SAM-dependent methyltransferase